MKIVAVSGGYDPIHIGHIRNIKEASKLGDKLIVILSRNDQLIRKKGFYFMTLLERKEILENIKGVNYVIVSIDEEITSNETLQMVKPNIFCKGGDRNSDNMSKKELEVCKKIKCKVIYNVGGDKVQSSSSLINKFNT